MQRHRVLDKIAGMGDIACHDELSFEPNRSDRVAVASNATTYWKPFFTVFRRALIYGSSPETTSNLLLLSAILQLQRCNIAESSASTALT